MQVRFPLPMLGKVVAHTPLMPAPQKSLEVDPGGEYKFKGHLVHEAEPYKEYELEGHNKHEEIFLPAFELYLPESQE